MVNRVKEVRNAFNLSRASFGERIGVSGDVINNLERGRVDIKEHIIKLICSEFNVNESWLRNGTGEMFVTTKGEYIEQIVKNYNLDSLDRSIIETYLSLSEESRKIIKSYIMNVVQNIEKSNDAKKQAWIDSEVEAYRKELEAEVKGVEKLSVSDISNAS